jgi:exodeoxyribonuclease VII large subunit
MNDETIHPINKLNARLRALVENETIDKPLWVGGLLRSVHESDFGHLYFNLVDDAFSIRCILRENRRGALGFTPQAGMEVEVFGVVRVYEQRATIEIEVEQMRLVERQRMTNFQTVEEQLTRRGLWPREKRPLPPEIHRIALITSKNSEAVLDFQNSYNAEKRAGGAAINLVDVRIQGDHAPQEIAAAIARVNNEHKADVIVLTRGGGRRADMTVFDDVLIAEAICRSDIPVITGIGHERDECFADRAADIKAGTPTAAAILLAKHGTATPDTSRGVIFAVAMIALIAMALLMMFFVFTQPGG